MRHLVEFLLPLSLLGCAELSKNPWGDGGEPGGGDGSGDYLLFEIGAPIPDGPPMADYQDMVPLEMTHFFDNSDPDNPAFECQHDPDDSTDKMLELDIPFEVPCVVAESPEIEPEPDPVQPAPYTGPVAQNPLPFGFDDWRGTGGGGCGAWSIAMCNRVLGISTPMTPVTEDEWNRIADEIKMDDEGGSDWRDRRAYYQSRGWCVERKKFHGSSDDYEEMQERRDEENCDVKLSYYRRVGDDYENGHIETVTGVTSRNATTNSWGHVGIVEGGSDGGFRHSGDGKDSWMGEDETRGGPNWPPDETDVWVTYVCDCQQSSMERLAALLFND